MAVWAGVAVTLFVTVIIAPTGINGTASATSDANPQLQQFQILHEPSGAQQLPDGRVLVIEDENLNPFSILTFDDEGKVSTKRLQTPSVLDMAIGKPGLPNLQDLEGIDIDDRGYVYAITSHSRTEEGKRARSRESLIRFRVEGDKLVDLHEITNLRKALTKVHDVLKDAVSVADVKDDNGFNIEGLSFDRANRRLLIALRSPVIDGKGVIVVMENPDAAFEDKEKPKISDELIYLDLARGGIRAITFDPQLGGYLIISRREVKKNKPFKLWLWDGDPGHAPRRAKISGKMKIPNAEGITPVRVSGKEQLLIVFDDGNRVQPKGAHYLMLNYENLNIDMR